MATGKHWQSFVCVCVCLCAPDAASNVFCGGRLLLCASGHATVLLRYRLIPPRASQYFEGATRQYKRIVAAREAGSPLPPPPHVVACATGTCVHPQHAGNKGKAAPKDWDPAEPKPAPPNIYTRGWLRNLAEVAWPRAARVRREQGAAGEGALSSSSRSRKGGKRE